MRDTPEIPSAVGLRVGIVVSRYHTAITDALLEGAKGCFRTAGGRDDDLSVTDAPGTFELSVLSAHLARSGTVDAIVALGCVVRGETDHDRHIAAAVAQGLSTVGVETGVPVALGVITCHDLEQAKARSGGAKGNKGVEAMAAAIAAAHAITCIDARKNTPAMEPR